MPIKSCRENNRPGWKYGDSGKCYTYTQGDKEGSKRARKKAEKQAQAIHSTGWREGKGEEIMTEEKDIKIKSIEELELELADIKKSFEELKKNMVN
jgi:hypothetical protein